MNTEKKSLAIYILVTSGRVDMPDAGLDEGVFLSKPGRADLLIDWQFGRHEATSGGR